MKPNEFKKLLDEALKPIIKTQKEHTKTLDTHTKALKSQSETLDSLSSSVVTMETTIGVYGDMYKINNDNSRKLEKRVVTLEDNAGVEAPPELTLLKVQ